MSLLIDSRHARQRSLSRYVDNESVHTNERFATTMDQIRNHGVNQTEQHSNKHRISWIKTLLAEIDLHYLAIVLFASVFVLVAASARQRVQAPLIELPFIATRSLIMNVFLIVLSFVGIAP